MTDVLRAMSAVVLVAAATFGPTGPAVAVGRNLGEEARWAMSLTYSQFVDYKNHGAHPYSFDFSSDGCSSTPQGLRQIFDQPCQLHDFGYRNFGNGLRLGRDEATRTWIDNRFHEEMDRLCGDLHQGFAEQGNRTVCEYQAEVIYGKVRQLGAEAYFA